jgi:hypothetical protein
MAAAIKVTKKPAKGVKGFLLYNAFNRKYFFRVYNKNTTFKDYDLCAYDIEICITDSFISLVREKSTKIAGFEHDVGKVDYSDQVVDCGKSRQYKGIRPPKCNGGTGCEACRKKYLKGKKRP